MDAINRWHIQQGQQSEARQLCGEADELHTRLNNAAYTILAAYSRSAYGHHANNDPRIVRLNRLIEKAGVRRYRRWLKVSEIRSIIAGTR